MTKRAVVVGINDYSHQVPGWPNLRYCVADANAVYHLLLDSFEFDPAGITLLTDQAASSANIRRALGHMLAVSEPGDVAFFFYSGHGGCTPAARRACSSSPSARPRGATSPTGTCPRPRTRSRPRR
ncbi:MAG: caspase family protein [Micropruina sp.]|nr:MAG: caspase family protein [Micropruina sp.]